MKIKKSNRWITRIENGISQQSRGPQNHENTLISRILYVMAMCIIYSIYRYPIPCTIFRAYFFYYYSYCTHFSKAHKFVKGGLFFLFYLNKIDHIHKFFTRFASIFK